MRANTGSFLAENLMPLIPRLASKEDIVLANFGLHTNDNGSLWNYIQVRFPGSSGVRHIWLITSPTFIEKGIRA